MVWVSNSLPNDQISDWSNLKAFADDIIVNHTLKFDSEKGKKYFGKNCQEMLVTSIFSLPRNVYFQFNVYLQFHREFLFLTLSQTSPGFYVSAVQVF